jgi:hypothetical protein
MNGGGIALEGSGAVLVLAGSTVANNEAKWALNTVLYSWLLLCFRCSPCDGLQTLLRSVYHVHPVPLRLRSCVRRGCLPLRGYERGC